jgi:ankyrin repeat protein/pilin
MLIKKFLKLLGIALLIWIIFYGPSYLQYYSIEKNHVEIGQLFESLTVVNPLKRKVSSYYREYGEFPESNKILGVGTAETFAQINVSKVQIGSEGLIEIVFKNVIEDQSSIFFKPYISYSGVGSEVGWQCYSFSIGQSYLDQLRSSCEYRKDKTPPTPPQPPAWAVSNSENLINAIHRKRRGMVLHIINEGINVNAEGNGQLPLQAAIEENNLDIVESLIDVNADVKARISNQLNMTMLMLAASKKNINPNIISLLLKHGADISSQDDDGRTALMHAARVDNPYVISTLINKGADIKIEDKKGNTAANHALNNRSRKSSSYYKLTNELDKNKDIIYVLPNLDD